MCANCTFLYVLINDKMAYKAAAASAFFNLCIQSTRYKNSKAFPCKNPLVFKRLTNNSCWVISHKINEREVGNLEYKLVVIELKNTIVKNGEQRIYSCWQYEKCSNNFCFRFILRVSIINIHMRIPLQPSCPILNRYLYPEVKILNIKNTRFYSYKPISEKQNVRILKP